MNASSNNFTIGFVLFLLLIDVVVIFGPHIKKWIENYNKNRIPRLKHALSLTSKHTSPMRCGIRPCKEDLHELAWELYESEVYTAKRKACFLTVIKVKNISLLRYRLEERLGEMNVFCDMRELTHPHNLHSY